MAIISGKKTIATCRQCKIETENKGLIAKDQDAKTYLFQCPKCKNIELEYEC